MDDTVSCWEFAISGDTSGHLENTVAFRAPALPRVEPAHFAGKHKVLYDLALPTTEELKDDNGMSAFLAECKEED